MSKSTFNIENFTQDITNRNNNNRMNYNDIKNLPDYNNLLVEAAVTTEAQKRLWMDIDGACDPTTEMFAMCIKGCKKIWFNKTGGLDFAHHKGIKENKTYEQSKPQKAMIKLIMFFENCESKFKKITGWGGWLYACEDLLTQRLPILMLVAPVNDYFFSHALWCANKLNDNINNVDKGWFSIIKFVQASGHWNEKTFKMSNEDFYSALNLITYAVPSTTEVNRNAFIDDKNLGDLEALALAHCVPLTFCLQAVDVRMKRVDDREKMGLLAGIIKKIFGKYTWVTSHMKTSGDALSALRLYEYRCRKIINVVRRNSGLIKSGKVLASESNKSASLAEML